MRLAVVADIHGNVLALEAVMADMRGRRIDGSVNLGDCASGPLWPRETIALLREMAWPTVRGNHDRSVAFDPLDTLGKSDRYTATALSETDRAWLGALPRTIALDSATTAMHARPADDAAYLLEEQWSGRLVEAQPETIRRRLDGVDTPLVLTAHSHLPRCVTLPGGPMVVNPGSVGCPAYDDDSTDPPHVSEVGSPAARYAIVESTPRGFKVELLSLPYDHEAAAARADENGRPDWAHALRTGYALRQPAAV